MSYISKECLACGFYDPDLECICLPHERWYACPIHVLTEEERIWMDEIAGKISHRKAERKLRRLYRKQNRKKKK